MENNTQLPRPLSNADFAEASAKYPLLILGHEVVDGDRVLRITIRKGGRNKVFTSITSRDILDGAWSETLLWTTTDNLVGNNPSHHFSRIYGRYLGIRKTPSNSVNEQQFLARLFYAAYECGQENPA